MQEGEQVVAGQAVACTICSTKGQSTVEYALVLVAFASMVLAMAVIWHAGRDGSLLGRAIDAASHQMGGGDALGALRDLALY